MTKPITTLFLIESLDGKITSGNSDKFNPDIDWSKIDGVKEGLFQYYDIEQTTDLCSLNTGKVMEMIGANYRKDIPTKSPCTFVIIDNKPHLNENGINFLCNWVTKLLLVTTNKNHIAHTLQEKYDNLEIISYNELNLTKLMEDLYNKYKINNVTIQSGGTLNELFLRENLIDYVHIVLAPLLVGGKDTPTLIDGKSITELTSLNKLKALQLLECNQLKNSYIQLKYKVIK